MIVLLLRELKCNWRSFRYPAFLLVLLFFALLNPPMTKHMHEIIVYFAEGIEMTFPDPTPEDAFISYLQDLSQIGILVLIFVTMSSVAREKETGVTGWMLSKPVGRWQYLTAKIMSLYLLVTIGLLTCSTVSYLYTLSLLGKIPPANALAALVNLLVFALFITTVTFTCSTVLKTPLQAGGVSLLLFFAGSILNLFLAETPAAKFYPNTLIAQIQPLVKGTVEATEAVAPILVTLTLIIILLFAAGSRFSRLEL